LPHLATARRRGPSLSLAGALARLASYGRREKEREREKEIFIACSRKVLVS
jgi:hypothetical protein